MKKAVFLDKDGTLIEDVPYNVQPSRIRLVAGAAEALQQWKSQHFQLIVVSNQPGVALGYFAEDALVQVRQRVSALLAEHGVRLAGFYYCPHHHDAASVETPNCTCRKPAPGMLLRAAAEHEIDLPASWLVGDILDDIEAGNRAGCRTVLVDCGGETQWRWTPERAPDHVVGDLCEAAERIAAAHRRSLATAPIRV
jgi:D-glycero-D-manno-heptose 1,7-bisphosphate phosphatase